MCRRRQAAHKGGPRLEAAAPQVQVPGVREFFTGPAIKAELLASWLEMHGIAATWAALDPESDPEDLGRDCRVAVPDDDYGRAQSLFFAEREDEL